MLGRQTKGQSIFTHTETGTVNMDIVKHVVGEIMKM